MERIDGVHPVEFIKEAIGPEETVTRFADLVATGKNLGEPLSRNSGSGGVQEVLDVAGEAVKETSKDAANAVVQLLTSPATSRETTTTWNDALNVPTLPDTTESSTIGKFPTTDRSILSRLSTTLSGIATDLSTTTLEPSTTTLVDVYPEVSTTDVLSTFSTTTESTTRSELRDLISDIFAETTDVKTAKSRISEIFSETTATSARTQEVSDKINETISDIFSENMSTSTSSSAPEFFWEFNTDVMAKTSTLDPTMASTTSETAIPTTTTTTEKLISSFMTESPFNSTTTENLLTSSTIESLPSSPTSFIRTSTTESPLTSSTTEHFSTFSTTKPPTSFTIKHFFSSSTTDSFSTSSTTEFRQPSSTPEPYSQANHSLTELFNPLKDTVSSLLEYSKELLAENLSPEMPTQVSLEQAGTDPSVTSTTMIGEVVTETASRAMENLTVGREENMATNLTANAFAA